MAQLAPAGKAATPGRVAHPPALPAALPPALPASLPASLPAALPAAIIVAGPTCSGKSALAARLAARFGGTVINADSMQVYRELRILTARPSPAEEAEVPHALYGTRPAAEVGSAAAWRRDALAAMAGPRLPILCGGTGLYLGALAQGIAPVPDPGEAARTEARDLLARHGAPALHARLLAADPTTAMGLRPSDGQRLARAWEVWRGTGAGLSFWQAQPGEPAPYRFRMILLDPPRPALRQSIAARFAAMLEAGAMEEVAALVRLGLHPNLPAMRAHGVPELSAVLAGRTTMEAAAAGAIQATGRYAKRQRTWFRGHKPVPDHHTHTIHAQFAGQKQFSESVEAAIEGFISGEVDEPFRRS